MDTIFQDILTNASTLLILLVAYKSGLLKTIMNGKLWNGGKTGDGKMDEMIEEMKSIRENHFEHLQKGQDDIKGCLKDIKNTLSNIEKYGVKVLKE